MKLGIQTNSNILNLMVMLNFSVSHKKYPFGVNLLQIIKKILFKMKFGAQTNSSMLNSIVMLICSVLDWKCPWAKFTPKLKNCLFQMKFGTQANSNMLNLILIINFFFCFDWKYPEFNSHVYLPCFGQIITFSEEFGSKNEN